MLALLTPHLFIIKLTASMRKKLRITTRSIRSCPLDRVRVPERSYSCRQKCSLCVSYLSVKTDEWSICRKIIFEEIEQFMHLFVNRKGLFIWIFIERKMSKTMFCISRIHLHSPGWWLIQWEYNWVSNQLHVQWMFSLVEDSDQSMDWNDLLLLEFVLDFDSRCFLLLRHLWKPISIKSPLSLARAYLLRWVLVFA